MPSARCSSSSRSAGLFSWVRASAAARLPHLGGEQQLPAARARAARSTGATRALVGDGEAAQLADLVAPELDPHRVLGRRREDVDDAAADGELAARGDHLDPGVRQLDQPDQQVVEVGGVADPQRHRVQPAQAGRDRLDQAARGGDDHAAARWPGRRAGGRSTAGGRRCPGAGDRRSCGSVSQLGQHGDGVAAEQVRRGGAQIVGLPVGGGDGEHGAAAPPVGERGGQERAQRRGALDGQRRDADGSQVAGCGGEGAEFGVRGGEQTGELGHDSPCSRHAGQTPARDGRGSAPRLRPPDPPRVGTFAGASRHVRGRESVRRPRGSERHRTETRGARGGNTRRPSLYATHEQVRRA